MEDDSTLARMSLREFCAEWLRRAWHGRFERARKVQAVAALFSGASALALRQWLPDMSTAISLITWLPFVVFAAVFAGMLIYGLVTAPYEIYCKEFAQAKSSREEIASLKNAAVPQLAFVPPGDMGQKIDGAAFTDLRRIAVKNLSPARQTPDVRVTIMTYKNLATSEKRSIHKPVQ
jgi:hypothetical protein